jgi:acyl carrier protein
VIETFKQKIRDYVAKNFIFEDAYPYEDQESFLEKGVIDSTGVLELISFAQQEFGITIEDEELIPENLDSVENFANFICSKSVREVPQRA